MTKIAQVNVSEGKIVYANKAVKREKVMTVRINITREQADLLLMLASVDGFVNDAKTAQGRRAVDTRQVQNYTRLAIDGLIAKRKVDITIY